MEAAPGFEPGIKDLQSSALPLGYTAWSRGLIRSLKYVYQKKTLLDSIQEFILIVRNLGSLGLFRGLTLSVFFFR